MGRDDAYPVRMSKVSCLLQYVIAYLGHSAVATDLGHPYWIYEYMNPNHDMNQWLLLQFSVLLMMDAESVRNM